MSSVHGSLRLVRSKAGHWISTAGVALAVIGCAQDPAFIEKSTNATAEELRSNGLRREGDYNRSSTEGLESGPIAERGEDSDPGIEMKRNGDVIAKEDSFPPQNGSPYDGGESGKVTTGGSVPDSTGEESVHKVTPVAQPAPSVVIAPVIVVAPVIVNSPVVVNSPAPVATPVAVASPAAPSLPVVIATAAPAPTAAPTPRAGAEVSLEFNERPKAKVDILWVIDNSGSMKWAQSELANKFEAYARELERENIDFRLGITNTDVCEINWNTGEAVATDICPDKNHISGGTKVGGRMVGPMRGEFITNDVTRSKVLSPGSRFIEAFKDAAMVGVTGSGFEHGLTAAKLAIQKAQSGVNSGFLRSDAFLSVVVVSDEEDDGIQMWCQDAWGRTTLASDGKVDLSKCAKYGSSRYVDKMGMPAYALLKDSSGKPVTQHKWTADNFVSFLNDPAVKGEGKFRVSAITGLRGADGRIDCPRFPTSGPKESGTNYIKAANMTNGVVENICSQDWTAVLSNLGANTIELAGKIQLPHGKIPFRDSLVVYVDGHAVDRAKFTYEPAGNFLVFKERIHANTGIKVLYRETVE